MDQRVDENPREEWKKSRQKGGAQERMEHREAEEEKDRVKVRSCEAERAAKSHTDCTYSKLGSESG